MGAIKVRKAKGSKNVVSGIANVLASFNNTIVSITDLKARSSPVERRQVQFRGSRKSTAYAAQVIAQDAARNAMAHGLKDIVIRVSGPASDATARSAPPGGRPRVTSIVDVTPIPHNGCRPRKRRRSNVPAVLPSFFHPSTSFILMARYLGLKPASAAASASICWAPARRWNAAISLLSARPKSRRKFSEYAIGLNEKQKLRFIYGLLERNFAASSR